MVDYLQILLDGLLGYLGVIIGGLIAFLSAVGIDYFKGRREERNLIDNEIKRTYLDNSIVPVRNELAYTGNITLKVVNQVRRNFHLFKNAEELRDCIRDTRSRPEVKKIIGFEFSEAHGRIVYLYRFGDKLPTSIMYAFWWYSGFLDDILNAERMKEFLTKGKSEELTESLVYVARLTQSLRIWLEKKLLKLELVLREEKYKSYRDFDKTVGNERISKISNEIGGLHEVYVSEEKRRDRGEKWGQEMIDYMNAHP